MTKSLENKVALVTGGRQGIGKAIAVAMAEAGSHVAVCDLELSALEEVRDEIQRFGVKAAPLACDITNADQVGWMAAEILQTLGPIGILVNNAGISGAHALVDHPDELWQRMLDVNLSGVYRVCKAVVPQMVEADWGRIINIASIRSKVGDKLIAAYTASKHGVLGLTRAMAVELNRHHITVNAICPAYVDTPMNDQTIANIAQKTGWSEEKSRETLEKRNPQHRLIDPQEIAALSVMLASEDARGITGQGINIDGGMVQF